MIISLCTSFNSFDGLLFPAAGTRSPGRPRSRVWVRVTVKRARAQETFALWIWSTHLSHTRAQLAVWRRGPRVLKLDPTVKHPPPLLGRLQTVLPDHDLDGCSTVSCLCWSGLCSRLKPVNCAVVSASLILPRTFKQPTVAILLTV